MGILTSPVSKGEGEGAGTFFFFMLFLFFSLVLLVFSLVLLVFLMKVSEGAVLKLQRLDFLEAKSLADFFAKQVSWVTVFSKGTPLIITNRGQ